MFCKCYFFCDFVLTLNKLLCLLPKRVSCTVNVKDDYGDDNSRLFLFVGFLLVIPSCYHICWCCSPILLDLNYGVCFNITLFVYLCCCTTYLFCGIRIVYTSFAPLFLPNVFTRTFSYLLTLFALCLEQAKLFCLLLSSTSTSPLSNNNYY